VVNSRAIAFVIGLVGACAGVVALAMSAPVVGLAAGALALGAGVSALNARDDTSEFEQRLALHEATEEDLRSKLAEGVARLDAATARIDALEAELAASQAAPEPTPEASDDLAVLTDHDSQLFSEAYFRVALDARIASARRHLRPVAIALIDVYEGLAGAGPGPANPGRAAESIRETVRDADTACRLADGTFAIILEDTPENGAVWTVERVRRNLVSRFGSHTMWAGVACYPAHAFSGEELMEQARLALDSAREWKQDRIEVAIAE
jgi:two-component system cell cycle response regulator